MARNLRDHLIATAVRLIKERGGAGLSVRDIAREAEVADGVLYNYFADKEDLLAQAMLVHVGSVMGSVPGMPEAGTDTVAGNLHSFIDTGLEVLGRVAPAFAGMLSQPGVLSRFHAMVGGDPAFGLPAEGGAEPPKAGQEAGDAGGKGLPALLTGYLRAEQRLGRIDADADIDAAVTLIVGTVHGQVLPRLFFSPPGGPVSMPPGLALRLAQTMLSGIGPRPR